MLSWNKRGEASLSQEREERRRKIEMAEIDPLLTRPSSRRSVRLSTAFRRRSSRRSAAHRELGGGRKISIACLFSFRRRVVWQPLSLSLSENQNGRGSRLPPQSPHSSQGAVYSKQGRHCAPPSLASGTVIKKGLQGTGTLQRFRVK